MAFLRQFPKRLRRIEAPDERCGQATGEAGPAQELNRGNAGRPGASLPFWKSPRAPGLSPAHRRVPSIETKQPRRIVRKNLAARRFVRREILQHVEEVAVVGHFA